MNEIKWPGWEVVRLIGSGSFGAVYEINRDIFGHTECAALKVISIPQNESDIQELRNEGYDEESITDTFKSHMQNILNEYSLMREMKGCANIVDCDDVRFIQHEDGIGWDVYIKMELLTPFTSTLSNDVPEETVIRVGTDICKALSICGKYGIIHRDIKPQNIFVSKFGDYKLGDFGIAKAVEKTSAGTKIGTYKYMAPEVYNNQPYGAASDQYSLGLVLYWLLNERRMPFVPLPPAKLTAMMDEEARTRRLSGEPFPAPAHGSPALQAIVLKACAYDPKDRFESAAEMLDALSALKNSDSFSDAAAVPTEAVAAPANDAVASAVPDEMTSRLADCRKERVEEDATISVFEALPDQVQDRQEASLPEETSDLMQAERERFEQEADDTENTESPAAAPKKNKKLMRRMITISLCAFVIIAILIGVILSTSNAGKTLPAVKTGYLPTASKATEPSKAAVTEAAVTEAAPEQATEQPKETTAANPAYVANISTFYEGEKSIWKKVTSNYENGILTVDPYFDVEAAMNLVGRWNGRIYIGSKSSVGQVTESDGITIELLGIDSPGNYQIDQMKKDPVSGETVGTASYTVTVSADGSVSLASFTYDKSVWSQYSVWPETVSGKVFLHINNFGWYGEWDFESHPQLTIDTYSCGDRVLMTYVEYDDSYTYCVDPSQAEGPILFQIKEYATENSSPFSTLSVELSFD